MVLQDCKKPVSGKSYYCMEGKAVCAACVGVSDDEEEEGWWTASKETASDKELQ